MVFLWVSYGFFMVYYGFWMLMDAYTPRSSEDLLGFIVTIVVDLPTKQNADTVDGPAKSCTTKRMVETHPK